MFPNLSRVEKEAMSTGTFGRLQRVVLTDNHSHHGRPEFLRDCDLAIS
jgi:hypothetical protein